MEDCGQGSGWPWVLVCGGWGVNTPIHDRDSALVLPDSAVSQWKSRSGRMPCIPLLAFLRSFSPCLKVEWVFFLMCAHSRKKLSYPPPGHIIEQSVLVECIIQQTSPLKVKSRGENHRKWGQVAFVSSALYLLFVLLNILAPLLRFIDSVYSSWNELHKFVVLFTLLGMFSPSVFLKENHVHPTLY